MLTFESDEKADANTYTVTIMGLNYLGTNVAEFNFDVEFEDPCLTSTLSPISKEYEFEYTVVNAAINFDATGQFESSLGDYCGEIVMTATGETDAIKFEPSTALLTIETSDNS